MFSGKEISSNLIWSSSLSFKRFGKRVKSPTESKPLTLTISSEVKPWWVNSLIFSRPPRIKVISFNELIEFKNVMSCFLDIDLKVNWFKLFSVDSTSIFFKWPVRFKLSNDSHWLRYLRFKFFLSLSPNESDFNCGRFKWESKFGSLSR